ncbi:MAG: 30S ribosomal protein S2 [Candidatus Enteromonas sp.]|nr:30S ribosomal protein S2 [Candidatus Enteromonas sp.]
MSDEIKETVAEETAAPVESAEPTMAEVFHDPNAPIITMKKCLEAGVHFGHQTHRWNPKMGKFIYGARNGIYIIDLNKTVERTIAAYSALKSIVEAGGKVLFVGTKAQAQQIVIDEAVRSGSFYITNRWLGGTLTNWRTIASRIKRLRDLDAAANDGSWEKLPKKEVALLRKELAKLEKNLGGLKEMRRTPQAIVLADPSLEKNAALEARKLGIPVFALCDTNDDPELVDFPIPTNNDATSAIKLVVGVLADAVVEARAGVTQIAYTKDEGEEATMADAIRVADIAAEQHRAAVRAARKAREERYAKMRAEREARFQARRAAAAAAAGGEKKEEAPKAQETK